MIIKPFDLEDVFTMSEIIDKMGLDADVRNVISQVNVSKLENADENTEKILAPSEGLYLYKIEYQKKLIERHYSYMKKIKNIKDRK